MVTYARCCLPIPGDPIMGYLWRPRRGDPPRVCGNLAEYRKQPDKWVGAPGRPPDRRFPAEIKIEVDNRPGVLAEVAAAIADSDSNIEHVAIDEGQDEICHPGVFGLLVRDRSHLAGVIRDLRRMNIVRKLKPDVHMDETSNPTRPRATSRHRGRIPRPSALGVQFGCPGRAAA